ncbi:MAG: glycosyltransferase family 9 protein [Candidatus Scalindua sediminis]|nr:glycosyltransferase family 9 protein [Candidatus Scalindua sediminis]
MNALQSEKHISQYNRIIIFRQGQFGDTLVAFPAIEALHLLYPNTSLVYCTNHFKSKEYVHGGDVARLCPHIQEVVTYSVEDSILQKRWELKEKLKVGKNDLLIYLPYYQVSQFQVVRDWFFFKTLNFCNMLGFKEAWRWAGYWRNTTDILPKETDRLLGILQSAGIPVESRDRCAISFDDDWGRQKWQEWGLENIPVLAICPGSKMQSKRWPIERYIKVGREWHKRTGMSLVMVGGPEESEIANEIISHWHGYGFSSCGATLTQTAAVLSLAQAYCGNDTGNMHLAAILGIPCVAIFSARAREKVWYPVGNRNVVLSSEVPCANCQLVQCHTSPPLCLELISVEQVLDALEKVWNAKIKNRNDNIYDSVD